MAEGGGGPDEDSGDAMLAGVTTGSAISSTLSQQHQPLNLKAAEESDRESSIGLPEPASTMGMDCTTSNNHTANGLFSHTSHHQLQMMLNAAAVLHNRTSSSAHIPSESPTGPDSHEHSSKTATATASHLNGTMADMVALQNLQNLASLNLPKPVNFTNSSRPSSPPTNGPLNLSVTSNKQSPPRGTPSPTAPAMPQFILASGQLVHGIQGAQLLIPTSQGIATQTILTIPVNHVNSNDQMVNLALNNGQVMTTSLANLQAMAVPNSEPENTNIQHLLNNNNVSTQKLLSALQPTRSPSPQPLLTLARRPESPGPQNLSQRSSSASSSHHAYHSPTDLSSEKHNGAASPTLNPIQTAALNSISRLTANNTELTITTTHGPASTSMPPSIKLSPSSMKMSPCTDTSTADLLIDSPNQPTINQTTSNVVDGINLDEIKEFAKAFKLRRLSLGLTQTQVGQALSITEGPAYSQSAICSALATQMYCAAQLSSQQQSMFEKLDITPKSAQKIKPVLERWMKEAEERYKSGQNHLTDFIGVEPSKKRKRRTSFTPQALELLNAHFERNTHPSGTEITGLAHQLGYEREVIRIWFCNKRQALKNTVRMMSKGMV